MRNTTTENVAEHSHTVTVIAHALCLIERDIFKEYIDENKLLTYALYHESSEVLTGDLPTPIKYNNFEINRAYKSLERVANDKLLTMLPLELKESFQSCLNVDADSKEYRLVKIADKLAALIKCIEEEKSGNTEFRRAKQTIQSDLKKIECKSKDYFMETFLPSYHLTLDEME